MTVIVVPHDPHWAQEYSSDSAVISAALGPTVTAIHHIGSTSISGIYAKPIIDLLVEVRSVAEVDERTERLTTQGYEAMGEYGLPGRRYFRKESPVGVRKFHVHAYAAGSAEAERHLAFRDYLRAHSEVAEEYSELKRRLAERFPTDIEAYMDGKDPFIQATEAAALVWWRSA